MAEKDAKKTKRPTAQKRMLQNEKKRMRNRVFKSRIRSAVRNCVKADGEEALKHINTAYSLIDKGVKIGVLQKNTAARTKQRLALGAQKRV